MKLFGLVGVLALAFSAPVGRPSPGLSERVPFASDAVRQQHIATFQRRNPGWVVDGAHRTSDLSGAIVSAEKRGRGPVRPTTDADAIAKTESFVRNNADVLGIDASDLAGLQYRLFSRDKWRRPRLTQIIEVVGKRTQPGFERFFVATRYTHLYVQVYDDGEVGSFGNDSQDVPTLHIRSKAALAKNDARVTANIVGRPFEVFGRVAMIPGTYQSTYRKRLTAPITASDVRKVELDLMVDYEKAAQVYTLAYRVDLERGDDRLHFLVDADTGIVLREPEASGPLVP